MQHLKSKIFSSVAIFATGMSLSVSSLQAHHHNDGLFLAAGIVGIANSLLRPPLLVTPPTYIAPIYTPPVYAPPPPVVVTPPVYAPPPPVVVTPSIRFPHSRYGSNWHGKQRPDRNHHPNLRPEPNRPPKPVATPRPIPGDRHGPGTRPPNNRIGR